MTVASGHNQNPDVPGAAPRTDLVVVHGGTEQYEGKQGPTFFVGISRQSAGAQGLCMHVVSIPPGATHQPHLHEHHESVIYVVSGKAEGRYGENLEHRVTAEPGDFVYIPAGVPHQAINPSPSEPLVAIIARTDPDEQESVVLLDEQGRRRPGC
jgi:uncharacterized RmlC-like cupin family protein